MSGLAMKSAVVWANASLKGGVGKTTTAATLAHGLALAGNTTLLVDCDVQNQARVFFDLGIAPGLDALLLKSKGLDEVIIPGVRPNLDILQAGEELSEAAREIILKGIAQEKALQKALKPAMSRYDYIILDSSPGWDIILINVLWLADFVITPLLMTILSIESYAKFLKKIIPIQEEKPGFDVTILLPTLYERRLKDARTILKQLKEMEPGKVGTPIRKTVTVERSPSIGKTIMDSLKSESEPTGVLLDYLELINKVIEVSRNGR